MQLSKTTLNSKPQTKIPNVPLSPSARRRPADDNLRRAPSQPCACASPPEPQGPSWIPNDTRLPSSNATAAWPSNTRGPMGASGRTADLPIEDGPSKRSLFSLLSLPLRSRTRNRNLAEFYVQVDDPHRQYSAGDHVTGSVILSVIKPVRITHLTVCLHGHVRVYKNAAQVASINPAIVPSEGTSSTRYFGNGHAQLFSDEQVLCGEGRLEARRWEFKFDLLFPSKGLPSSIDFERGSISYLITATLTRPTSIAPTTSAERKLSFLEKVDVGLVPVPRERKVTMHAMHKRRRKRTAATANTPTKNHSTGVEGHEHVSDMDSMRANETSNDSSVNLEESMHPRQDDHHLPRSPIQSDIQSEVSTGSAASHNSNSARGADGSNGSKVSGGATEDREITATVELLKGGCTPGDLLPVRIKVDHNRRMKSLHGIIVTFFRQGRVDYAPPSTLFTDLSKDDIKKLEREEYYPKSRTGLGGLSLSSAGSCSVFRKDLSQAVAPLIIDPRTLSANITTSVRVPEDVFPSIKGVPGSLITFKYHVEVVVDLGGRLAGQSQGSTQQPTRMASMSVSATGPSQDSYDRQLSRLANWNGTIVDTDHLRREKGVISVSFEVVVGNVDTNRSRSKSVARPALNLQPPSEHGYIGESHDMSYTWQERYEEDGEQSGSRSPWNAYDQSQTQAPPGPSPQVPRYEPQGHGSQAPSYVPPPQLPAQNGLSEKERVRQAEQRLLPSQPPAQSSEPEAGPSQPSAPTPNGLAAQPSDPVAEAETSHSTGEEPSAPTLADLSSATHTNSTDDKQELERRRLLAEASSPPEMPEDYEAGGPSAPAINIAGPPTSEEPSAPMFEEHDAYGSRDPYDSIAGPSTATSPHGHDHGTDDLPRYER
ncbi:hypothetical protein JX266_006530 [Neoarthrinium moseri]|uniref:uncharacterized protein n=1 Tax=Neoarthrinium moseri TaxID=1658444 RepID=UPI001FDD07E1|nr:uncharacterized protein JN550_013311 [Neoarthrinium moseri]KAI1847305.1 hypothetical protein JX266_006530 [Neoarthrinium moseri]KAI1857285.1 hypothetical protein JN550_013311 [Neoarthrinium moseri]